MLLGDIPKNEYKVVFEEDNKEQIDTTTAGGSQAKKQSELVQQYMLGAFEGSRARASKNRQYYEQHLRAIESQKEEEEAEDQEHKKKMLHLASLMQYEDDFDDQNLGQGVANQER